MKTPVQIFTVTAAEAGQKLLQYLVRRLDGALPPAALQRLIRTGQVRLDGKRVKPFDRIGQGQKVRMPPFETDAMPVAAQGGTPAASPAPRIAAVPRPAR
ncbi:MAG TPA: RluA family pseudouridine synthase, partial [Solidesulfovibrio sp.]|nr:RluA family pseudouridine synthase [Solidesulfovibrio sp.]